MANDIHHLYILRRTTICCNEILDVIAEIIIGVYLCTLISLTLLFERECEFLIDVGSGS